MFLVSTGVKMLPMSLVIVCYQTSPFWISIIARIWLKEKIILLEIIGMIICFCMVGAIAIDAKVQEDEMVQQEGEVGEEDSSKDMKFTGIILVLLSAIN